MKRQFQPTNKGNACPICDDISGKCRITDQDLVLCMELTSAQDVPGWRFTKLTKNGLWGTWAPDEGKQYDPIQWQLQKAEREAARQRKQSQQRKQSLSPTQRDKYYRQLLASLKLDPIDREDLTRRGFTDEEIREAGFKSVEPWQKLDIELPVNLPGVSHHGKSLIVGSAGYLCPCYDHKQRIVGMQVRFRVPRGKQRYAWLSSSTKKRPNGAPPALANGENPLTLINQFSDTPSPVVYLAEGTGAKPWLTARILNNSPVIGAAGGMWGSSPQTLETTIKAVTHAQPAADIQAVLIPDAGDVSNPHLRHRNRRTLETLTALGYQVQVMWWGQVLKSDPDIDHLQPGFEHKLLSVDEFWEICDREKINAASREAQAKLNSLTVKPAKEFSEQYLPALHLPKPGGILFVDSPMGSGKTTQTQRLIAEYFRQNANGLVRFFGYRNALLRQTLETLQTEFPDRCIDLIHDLGAQGSNDTAAAMLNSYDVVGLCVDSLLKIDERSLSGALIFLDEVDAVMKHLLLGNTLSSRGVREKVMAKFQAILQNVLSTGGYVVAMEANLSDLTLQTLRGLAPKAPGPLILNHSKIQPWDVTLLNARESSSLVEEAVNGFRKGLKQVVACDSQAFAAELEGLVREIYPSAKIMRVDGKTSETEAVRTLITAPNEWIETNRPDFLIYTPTLESGADITTDYFDRMLFYLVNLETRAQMQLLGRIRQPIPRLGYVKDCAFADEEGRSLRPDVLFQEATRNVKGAVQLTKLAVALAEYSPEGPESWLDKLNQMVDPPEGSSARHWIDAWAGYKARENGARAEMRLNLMRSLRSQGHRITERSAEKSQLMSQTRTRVRQKLQQGEASQLAEEDATGITSDIAYKILASTNASEKNRRKARKALLAERLPGLELSADFIYAAVISDRGQLLKRTMQLWDVQNLEVVKSIDQKSWLKRMEHPFVFFPGVRHRALKAELLHRSGILKFIEDHQYKEFREGDADPRLQEFFDWCWWNRWEIRRVLGLTISKKTSLVKNLGKFIRKLGYTLTSRKMGVAGKQIRLWKIEHPDHQVQAEILAALSRRQAAIAEAISTTQHMKQIQAGVDTSGFLWKEGFKARVRGEAIEGIVTTLEPDIAVIQLADGSEWVHPLENLEVVSDAA